MISQPELWQRLSSEAKADLGRDLLAMSWKHGFAWTSDPLGQPVIARGWAGRVKEVFKQRGLTFDPRTVVNGHLKIPIPTPWIPDVAYIFAGGTILADFRTALANVMLVEKTKNHD